MALTNAAYFTALTEQVNAATSCAELQSITTSALEPVLALQTSITAQLVKIAPMLALLTGPSADPTAIVNWLNTFITAYLTPQLAPSVTLAAQLTAQAAAIAALTAAIESKAAQFVSCVVTVPS